MSSAATLGVSPAAPGSMPGDSGVNPVTGSIYPLEEGPQALRDLAGRRAVGKLVLTVR